jgi:hypothetical protein
MSESVENTETETEEEEAPTVEVMSDPDFHQTVEQGIEVGMATQAYKETQAGAVDIAAQREEATGTPVETTGGSNLPSPIEQQMAQAKHMLELAQQNQATQEQINTAMAAETHGSPTPPEDGPAAADPAQPARRSSDPPPAAQTPPRDVVETPVTPPAGQQPGPPTGAAPPSSAKSA